MRTPVRPFAIATLAPLPLLVAGALWGGWWAAAAAFYMTVFAFTLDQLVGASTDNADPACEFPAAERLSTVLALSHFGLLYLAVHALAQPGHLGAGESVLMFLAFGLFFGQVSNANAHELIHRPRRGLFLLGQFVFVSLLFGHHTSAHRLVHHQHVATPDDPNSAPLGMSFYRFAARAWPGSFMAGLRAENRLRRTGPARGVHPYAVYVVGAVGALGLSYLIAGMAGVLVHIALAAYATMQLLMSDYVQHYGLTRQIRANGKPEATANHHSWNAPHWFTDRLMLHAPRHSDHHLHPARPFPALQLDDSMPMLPRSLPVMGFVALFPRRWRGVMDPRVARWQARTVTAK